MCDGCDCTSTSEMTGESKMLHANANSSKEGSCVVVTGLGAGPGCGGTGLLWRSRSLSIGLDNWLLKNPPASS